MVNQGLHLGLGAVPARVRVDIARCLVVRDTRTQRLPAILRADAARRGQVAGNGRRHFACGVASLLREPRHVRRRRGPRRRRVARRGLTARVGRIVAVLFVDGLFVAIALAAGVRVRIGRQFEQFGEPLMMRLEELERAEGFDAGRALGSVGKFARGQGVLVDGDCRVGGLARSDRGGLRVVVRLDKR